MDDYITNSSQSDMILGFGISEGTADRGIPGHPSWSLLRLIQMCPHVIPYEGKYTLYFNLLSEDICEFGYKNSDNTKHLIFFQVHSSELVDSMIVLLNWLLVHERIDKKFKNE